MTNKNDITDYASFVKAKQQLKEEIDFHRVSIKEELKEGARNIRLVKLITGYAEKAAAGFAETVASNFSEKIVDSKLGQRVSNVLSIVNFVKDFFKKSKAHEGKPG